MKTQKTTTENKYKKAISNKELDYLLNRFGFGNGPKVDYDEARRIDEMRIQKENQYRG